MKGTVQGVVPLKLTCCPSGVSTFFACLSFKNAASTKNIL